MPRRLLIVVFALATLAGLATLAACAAPTPTPVPTAAPTPTLTAEQANLALIKTYLLSKTASLKASSAATAAAGQRYYDLAKAANFDYAALWSTKRPEVASAINAARTAWIQASPTYEQMEGIVAGTSSLSTFDTNLDAGSSAAQGGDNVVTFDIKLPDGRVLPKPGNLFGVTESSLWDSNPDYSSKVPADFNGNGQTDLGDSLPDANVVQASTAMLADYSAQLDAAANAWQPTDSDAFTALVANVPTVADFFDSWKTSRFVMGDKATHDDFVVISRLSDIIDNVSSWQAIYSGISPQVAPVDASQDQAIQQGLVNLKSYVANIYKQEQGGKHFTPEEADTLSAEAQNRATAIAGQIAQVAAKLGVQVQSN